MCYFYSGQTKAVKFGKDTLKGGVKGVKGLEEGFISVICTASCMLRPEGRGRAHSMGKLKLYIPTHLYSYLLTPTHSHPAFHSYSPHGRVIKWGRV